MRWEGQRESENVEDRRGMPMPRMAVGGGLGTLLLILVVWLLGGDPMALFQPGPPAAGPVNQQQVDQPEDELTKFVRVVLADTEDVWHQVFREQLHRQYRDPKLVLFTGQTQSGCGFASAATGPFYCPADHKVYLDLSFFDELRQRFQAPGDFAAAYVIAHEVGHHVQDLLGISDQVEQARGRMNEVESNRLSVRLELQADFLAGVWAHYADRTKHIIEQGDIAEAIRAASAIGDDRLQRQARGRVVPDSFTHGTSAQRVRWFRRGYESGDLSQMKQLFDLDYDEL